MCDRAIAMIYLAISALFAVDLLVIFTGAFIDASRVAVVSNGVYSANLSNLRERSIAYLLQVTDSGGNVTTIDPPLNLGDGSANGAGGVRHSYPAC